MLNNVTLSRNNFEHFPTGPPKQFSAVEVSEHYVHVWVQYYYCVVVKKSCLVLFYVTRLEFPYLGK